MPDRLRLHIELLGNGFLDLSGGACTRTIEIADTASLFKLAEAILNAFDFYMDHAFGFYDNLKNPYDSKDIHTTFADFDGEDPDHGKSVKKTKIAEVFSKGTKRLFLFDFGDDWMFTVECKQTGIPGKATGAVVVASHGDAPMQYAENDDEE